MLTAIRQPESMGQQWKLIREINTEIRIWGFTQGTREPNNITIMDTANYMNSKTMSLKSKKRKKSTRWTNPRSPTQSLIRRKVRTESLTFIDEEIFRNVESL